MCSTYNVHKNMTKNAHGFEASSIIIKSPIFFIVARMSFVCKFMTFMHFITAKAYIIQSHAIGTEEKLHDSFIRGVYEYLHDHDTSIHHRNT